MRVCVSSAAALCLPLALAGCSLFPTTRKLPVPKAPAIVQTVTPEQLVAQLNKRWDDLKTLNSKVTIQASEEKTAEGLEKTAPTFQAVILLRKPESLRVYGFVPVIRTEAFDMVSDGKTFTIYVPSRKQVMKGSNALTKKSANELENLRPGFFFNAMVVRGVEPDELYSVTADSETVEDPAKKHLLITPEYVLSVMRQKPGSRQLTPVRVVTFDRDDLLPYQQDVYDDDGNLSTQVFYNGYRDFGGVKYPSSMTIKCPIAGIQLVITVLSVDQNQALKDDQFQSSYPADTPVKNLD